MWVARQKTPRRVKLVIHDWNTFKDYEWKSIELKDLDKTINEFNEKFKNQNVELSIEEYLELDYSEVDYEG